MASDDLLAVLVCVKCRGPLVAFPRGETGQHADAGFLLCAACRLRYAIEGIPVMLLEEAREVPPREVERLLAQARALGIAVPNP